MGCGACRDLDHDFEDYIDRAPNPPKLQITLAKPSAKSSALGCNPSSSSPGAGWTEVGSKNTIKKIPYPNPQGVKSYLSENGGISIVYISNESSEEEVMEPKGVISQEQNPIANEGTINKPEGVNEAYNPPTNEIEDTNNEKKVEITTQTYQATLQDPIEIEDDDIDEETVEVEFIQDEDEFEPVEENNEEPEDTTEIDPLPNIPVIDTYQLSPLFQESDVPFTDEEFNAMINDDTMFELPNPDFSDNTFHSMHNSTMSSSSMINQLGGLEMN